MNNIDKKLLAAIKQAANIVICGHAMPDGDSIGSTVAMGLAAKKLGKQAIVISPDPIPRSYTFLPGAEDVGALADFPANCDLAIVLDCTDLYRGGKELAELLTKVPTIINIDHHVSNQQFGHFNYVDPKAAATGELVFHLIRALGLEISQEMATNLYTAIAMDTGSFRYDNTRAGTHIIAADLINTGISAAYINDNLFERREIITLKLLGRALNSINLSPCGRVAWISVPISLMEELGARDEHADGIVNYPKNVEGVIIGLFFREVEPGKVKVGFRSRETADVNKLAALFGGGGHPRAAGCLIDGDLKDVEEKVVKAALAVLSEECPV